MPRFRKKPVIVEAEQWFPDHPVEGVIYPAESPLRGVDGAGFHELHGQYGWIETLEGGHVVSPGDWIITGVQGEKYLCKPDIFAATYEPVEDSPSTDPLVICDHADRCLQRLRGVCYDECCVHRKPHIPFCDEAGHSVRDCTEGGSCAVFKEVRCVPVPVKPVAKPGLYH